MKTIVLNKLFRGEYLKENLGHEIINFFKSDNGKSYVYLNESGKFASKYANSIKDMIFVTLGRTNTLEVIGKAEYLTDVYDPKLKTKEEFIHQIQYIIDNDIKYGGTYLHAIFAGNEYQYVNITFKAKSVIRILPGKRILLSFDNKVKPQNGETLIYLNQLGSMRSSLKEYCENTKFPQDYKKLENLISNNSIWGDEVQPINPEAFMTETFYQRINQNRHINKLFK